MHKADLDNFLDNLAVRAARAKEAVCSGTLSEVIYHIEAIEFMVTLARKLNTEKTQ